MYDVPTSSSTAATDNAATCPHNIIILLSVYVLSSMMDPETERGNETMKNCTRYSKKGRLGDDVTLWDR